MKTICLFVCCILYQNMAFGQEFIETDSITPFPNIDYSSLKFFDTDGDLDEDLIMIGWKNGVRCTKLFVNDGTGNFSEDFNSEFEQVSSGKIATSDIDGDGDKDLLICGMNSEWKEHTSLYFNQGDGTFLENFENTLENIWNGELEFFDADGDSDQDILIVGQNEFFEDIAKLYLNNGSGKFEELSGTPFIGVRRSSIGIGDIDNDNDLDIIISGNGGTLLTNLYINDGNVTFSLYETSKFIDLMDGTISLSDVDGDSDLDVMISGFGIENMKAIRVTKLYLNNGEGVFSEDSEQNFLGVSSGSVTFIDIDGDSDKDLFITGINQNLKSEAKLYLNDGLGSFKELETEIKSIYEGEAAFSDIDNDGDPDLVLIGRNSESSLISKKYITLWIDQDQDGFLSGVDCDDSNANINPDQAEEPYNRIDDDCNTLTLDDDLDQDGFLVAGDCDDNNADINPNQIEEPYNGTDDDCNTLTLDDDLDQDGFLLTDDCDDNNPDINPIQTELPYNGLDDDCNTATLDDDLDQDGFLFAEDCDENNADINPNAEEIPNNGIDEDCDGMDLVSSVYEIGNSTINIYPNPSIDEINIEINGQLKYIVNLYDLSGKTILTELNISQLKLNALSQGTYLLEIKDLKTSQHIVEKIIIRK